MKPITAGITFVLFAAIVAPAAADKPASPPGHSGDHGASANAGNPHAPGTSGNPHVGGNGNPHASGPPGNPVHPTGNSGSGGSGGSSGATSSASASTHAAGGNGNGNGPAPQSRAGKVTICHSTGSPTNPYVVITMSANALPAHMRHHDGADKLPGADGTCADPVAITPANAPAGSAAVLAAQARSGGGAGSFEAAADTIPPSVAEDATDERPIGSLPFTGADLGLLVAVGLGALGAGLALRPSRSQRI